MQAGGMNTTTTYLIAEKNASRMLHVRYSGRNRKRQYTLEVARAGFPDVGFFSEQDGIAAMAKLKANLPEFTFELCSRDQFETKYTEGSLAGRLFRK